MEQASQVQQVAAIERHITTLHLAEFPPAVKPELAEPTPVSVDELTQQLQAEAVKGIPWWRRNARRDALNTAAWTAPGLAAQRTDQQLATYKADAAVVEAHWNKLIDNDPETVLTELEAAFSDNESPAVAVNCTGSTVHLVILFPNIDLIPERKSATTPGGKPTLKPRTKTERNQLYVNALGSTVLATLKEAYAVAPAITEIAVAVIRHEASKVDVIYTGTWNRAQLSEMPWSSLNPAIALAMPTDAQILRTGATKALTPLPVEDGLRDLLRAVREALHAQADKHDRASAGD